MISCKLLYKTCCRGIVSSFIAKNVLSYVFRINRIKSDVFLNSSPEFQYSIVQLTKSMHAIHKAFGVMCDSWQQRKQQLDQGIQLRMFEADCQKVYLFTPQTVNVLITEIFASTDVRLDVPVPGRVFAKLL